MRLYFITYKTYKNEMGEVYIFTKGSMGDAIAIAVDSQELKIKDIVSSRHIDNVLIRPSEWA